MEISVSQRLDWDQQPRSGKPGSDSLLSFLVLLSQRVLPARR